MSLVFQRISSPFRDLMAGSARPVRSTRDDALEIATRSALTWLSSIAVLNLLWYAAVHFAGH